MSDTEPASVIAARQLATEARARVGWPPGPVSRRPDPTRTAAAARTRRTPGTRAATSGSGTEPAGAQLDAPGRTRQAMTDADSRTRTLGQRIDS